MRHTRKPCPFSDEEIIAAAFAVAAGDETHQSRIKIADVQRYLIKNNITPTVAGALGDKESIVSGTKISRVLRTPPPNTSTMWRPKHIERSDTTMYARKLPREESGT